MNRNFSLLCVLCVSVVPVSFAQPSKFVIQGPGAKGTEEFNIEKTADGWRQSGTTHLEVGGGVDLKQELVLSADREFMRYRLEVRGQILEAKRDGDKVQLTAGPQTRTVDFRPGMVVLDNNMTAHYQVLLDRLPKNVTDLDVDVLIPQALLLAKAKLHASGEESATVDGKTITVRKYTLDLGGSRLEMYAAADSNKLMRVAVPLASAEFTREGFAPAPKAAPEKATACLERDLKFASGEIEVPGTFCMPKGAAGRVPVVVFVHGSGAHDRDETIGPNKPFRDLAQGLAEAGIGSLRYDKRTFFMGAKMTGSKLTVEEEVIADAVAALAYARTLPETDPKQLFMLGHSLGGALAPFIVARAPETRGAILLAGAPRPLDELILEQNAFQGRASGQDEAAIASHLDELKKTFVRIRSGEMPDGERFMNAPAYYWRDLLKRDIPAAWKQTKPPVLVLQGGQDVQVRRADYDLLVATLGTRCEAHFLPTLNHLFMPVEGKATGAEYSSPGHVDPQVTQLISKWVKSLK